MKVYPTSQKYQCLVKVFNLGIVTLEIGGKKQMKSKEENR